jgi:hypothetical protein
VGSFSAAAVTRVVVYVRTAIERDWLRANEDLRLLSDMPADYFRGRDPQIAVAEFLFFFLEKNWLQGRKHRQLKARTG